MFKNSLISLVALLAVVFLCFGTEPNDNTNNTFSTAEARMLALEQRLDALEWRVNRLESSPRYTEPTLPTKKTKDETRVERLRDKIQEMEDAIELAEKRIESLSPYWPCRKPVGFKPHPAVVECLEMAKKEWQFLADQEKNYKQILQLAEKYSDLEVNVMDIKKKLIECQERIKEVEWRKQHLREITNTN